MEGIVNSKDNSQLTTHNFHQNKKNYKIKNKKIHNSQYALFTR